jgi:hypothetical protein
MLQLFEVTGMSLKNSETIVNFQKLLTFSNSPAVAHVGCDISPLSRVKFKILTTRLTACG